MKDRQVIPVTEADIDKATPKDSRSCAVATAIASALPDARRISVDMLWIKFTENEDRMVFPTPAAVQNYIVNFDAGEPTPPFSFRLDKRNRVIQQRYVRTAEGNELTVATQKVTDRKRRVEEVAADPESTSLQQAAAQEQLDQATAALEEVKTRIGDKPRGVHDRPPKPPTDSEAGDGVISRNRGQSRKARNKSHVREYGLRTMRINQARAELGQEPL